MGVDRGHTVVARGGQHGVRARVRAAGKTLETNDRQTDDDRHTHASSIILGLNVFKHPVLTDVSVWYSR